jgi:hypothetical protein
VPQLAELRRQIEELTLRLHGCRTGWEPRVVARAPEDPPPSGSSTGRPGGGRGHGSDRHEATCVVFGRPREAIE